MIRNITTSSFNYVSASVIKHSYTDPYLNAINSGTFYIGHTEFNDSIVYNTFSFITGDFTYVSASIIDYVDSDTFIYEFEDYLMFTSSISGGGGGTAELTKYKMRGWRSATSQFEYWITTNPEEPPPTGNALIDITIAQVFSNGC